MKNDVVVESEQSENRLSMFLQKFVKKPDADVFFEEVVSKTLDSNVDIRDIGLYQRINTYLFQFDHYVGLIKRDIKSYRTNHLFYFLVYLIGMVIVPIWLIILEYGQIEAVNDAVITWGLISLYASTLLCGIWFSIRSIKKIKQISDSKVNLMKKASEVILACSVYNVTLFNDKKNGTSPKFDDDLNLKLNLDSILDYEFPTIHESYKKYLLLNEHFDYQNLAGIIRAHQALYNNRIKDAAVKAQQMQNERDLGNDAKPTLNVAENILNLHIAEITNLHKFYNSRIVDQLTTRKTKEV